VVGNVLRISSQQVNELCIIKCCFLHLIGFAELTFFMAKDKITMYICSLIIKFHFVHNSVM
jgi:hypothetical protein